MAWRRFVSSNDGEVSWAPVGGEGAYTYLFNGSDHVHVGVGFGPGEYEVVVTDGNNCSSQPPSRWMLVWPSWPARLSSTRSAGENDGEVTVTAEGGSGAFQYSDDGVNFADGNVFDDLNAESTPSSFKTSLDAAVRSRPTCLSLLPLKSRHCVRGRSHRRRQHRHQHHRRFAPYEYEWIGPGERNHRPGLTGISTGVYIVEVTDANGCSSDETFNLTTSIQEIAGWRGGLRVPNPSQGLFAVEIAGQTQGAVEYVLDAQGRMLTQGQWVGAGQLFREALDLTGADAGLYQLVLVANGRPTSVQIVKMN